MMSTCSLSSLNFRNELGGIDLIDTYIEFYIKCLKPMCEAARVVISLLIPDSTEQEDRFFITTLNAVS